MKAHSKQRIPSDEYRANYDAIFRGGNMICPECGAKMKVVRSTPGEKNDRHREYKCKCGCRFYTTEKGE